MDILVILPASNKHQSVTAVLRFGLCLKICGPDF